MSDGIEVSAGLNQDRWSKTASVWVYISFKRGKNTKKNQNKAEVIDIVRGDIESEVHGINVGALKDFFWLSEK